MCFICFQSGNTTREALGAAMRHQDLTLKELELFVLASRTQSFREVARQSGMLPAHVSKVMKKIEEKVDTQLFKRSVSGIILTPDALVLLETAEQICEMAKDLGASGKAVSVDKNPLWTIGSISFLTTFLLSPTIGKIRKALKKKPRFRLIEFTHNDLVAHGLKGAFELAIHIESLEWTQVWQSIHVGNIRWKLYGRADHPLGETCEESEALKYPFIVPTDWNDRGYTVGEDHCPISVRRRIKGDECATAETALELCKTSDQLCFIPEIMAKEWCKLKKMTEITVKSWPAVDKEIYLSVKTDVVPQWLLSVLSNSIKEMMKV
jgi:DNA-binding transcriptional LysR family regulator